MKFNLFSICLVLLILSTHLQAQDAPQASAAWQVVRYDLAAALPQNGNDRSLTARATLNLRNVGRGAGATVTLRINQKAEILSAKVGANTASFRKIAEDKAGSLQRFTVNLPGSIQPNENAAVTIEYRLPVTENTGLNAVSSVGSQFLPLSVWYPTPNNPLSPRGADFAPFRLSVTAANGETIISSGKPSGAAFEQNLNAQPFFAAGNWDTVDGANGAAAYLPKGAGADERKRAEELLTLANEAKTFTANLLGSAPDAPVRLVAVRRGAGFGDSGAILLDYAAFRRQKIDAGTALTVAEAVAKIWLGNSTTIRGEGNGAVREGLARFIATQFLEKQFGKDAADIERLRQRAAYAIVAQRDAPLVQTSPLDTTYFASTANKGAMIWRLAAKMLGDDAFFSIVRANLAAKRNEALTLADLREALSANNELIKTVFDYEFGQTTDMDLLAGLPVLRGAETVAALRNSGNLPVSVAVSAVTDKGERLSTTANIAEKSFGEAVFKTTAKIVRVEIDPEKLYPQFDYANDIAPRETTENDLQAAITQSFNRQKYPEAENAARKVLRIYPRFDDVRMTLGRILIEQNKLDEAEKEFNAALAEKLATARTLAWANVGLGEIASRRNQNAAAVKFFDAAVKADAEYGSNLAARAGRQKAETAANAAPAVDEAAKTFFANFDRAALTARKADVDALIVAGEMTKFSGGITGGQPEQWQTKVLRTEVLDANRLAVEVILTAKLIDKDAQTGTALFVLARTANGWKLAGVDLFEVR